jgi:hypothetical protein
MASTSRDGLQYTAESGARTKCEHHGLRACSPACTIATGYLCPALACHPTALKLSVAFIMPGDRWLQGITENNFLGFMKKDW